MSIEKIKNILTHTHAEEALRRCNLPWIPRQHYQYTKNHATHNQPPRPRQTYPVGSRVPSGSWSISAFSLDKYSDLALAPRHAEAPTRSLNMGRECGLRQYLGGKKRQVVEEEEERKWVRRRRKRKIKSSGL